MPTLAPILSPTALAALTASRPDVRVLDVRTPGEFESVHIRGAYNVPLDTLSEHSAEIAGVSAPVIFACQSGGRARRAEAALKAAGMANLHVLEGGMNAWVGAGLVFAGVTDKCGMALLLSRLPYNRASCDVPAMVRALASGRAPARLGSI